MGQSMAKPQRSGLRESSHRLSARSLHRSSRNSVSLEKRASLSASKVGEVAADQPQPPVPLDYSQPDQMLMLNSCYKPHETIRQQNSLRGVRVAAVGEGSVLSPNFREIAEGGEYGLGQWGVANVTNKSVQFSGGSQQHDMTISFSKTKNQINNPFAEEPQDTRGNLKQILEYEEQSQQELPPNHPASTDKPKYSANTSLSQSKNYVCKEDRGELGSRGNNLGAGKRKLKLADQAEQKVISKRGKKTNIQIEHLLSESVNTPQMFNDYDYGDFGRKQRDSQDGGKKGIKLSKNLLEVKEKIVSKANSSQLKQQLLKSTVHNLSKSFRSVRGCEIISEREVSKERSKPELSKVQCMNIKIVKDERETEQGETGDKGSSRQGAGQCSNKQGTGESNKITVCSSRESEIQRQAEKIEVLRSQGFRVVKPEKSSSKLLVFNGNNTYTYQSTEEKEDLMKANSPRGIRVRETAFTSIRSKLASPEDSLRNQTDKAQPIYKHINFNTARKQSEQQYEFFDVRSPKRHKDVVKTQLKPRESLMRVGQNRQARQSVLKNQQSVLNSRQSILKMKYLQGKQCPQKSNCKQLLSKLQYMMCQSQSRLHPTKIPKRHKSTEHSSRMSGLRSKLLIF